MLGIVDRECTATIYERPSIFSEVVGELPPLTQVEIDEEASDASFFKICTAYGVEGYCLKITFSDAL